MEPAPPADPPEPGVVVLGRFQPVHKGHALMIQAAEVWRTENASEAGLIIAIGSSNQPPSIRNPWSSEERTAMLRVWLDSAGIEAKIVSIPDIEDPQNGSRMPRSTMVGQGLSSPQTSRPQSSTSLQDGP